MAAVADINHIDHLTLVASEDGTPEHVVSLGPSPAKIPDAHSCHILVIGGGVSGLMTAWLLLDKGYKVTIIAREWAWTKDNKHPRLTSQIAGALWELPPGGCGITEIESAAAVHSDVRRYREWAMQSYAFYEQVCRLSPAHKRDFGVQMRVLHQFFLQPLEENINNGAVNPSLEKWMAVYSYGLKNQIHNVQFHNRTNVQKLLTDVGVTSEEYRSKIHGAYSHDAPVIDTDVAMEFLMRVVQEKGAHLETRAVEGDLVAQEKDLRRDYDADLIINATGLGSREIAGDSQVFPVRGAVKRIKNRNKGSYAKIEDAVLMPAQLDPDCGGASRVVFIVPRNDDTLIVGSIIQPNNWRLNLTEDSPEVQSMWTRATRFLPALKDADIDRARPLAQGLRPFSRANVRVAAETRKGAGRIVHNYGHGGSGWTLAVGCARTAVWLVDLMLLSAMTAAEANDVVNAGYVRHQKQQKKKAERLLARL